MTVRGGVRISNVVTKGGPSKCLVHNHGRKADVIVNFKQTYKTDRLEIEYVHITDMLTEIDSYTWQQASCRCGGAPSHILHIAIINSNVLPDGGSDAVVGPFFFL